MPFRLFWSLVLGHGRKPRPQRRMSGVRGGPVYRIHLVFQGINWHIDEKARIAVSSTAPNDVRGSSIPLGNFVNDPLAVRGSREIGADVVEFLSVDVDSGTLKNV